MRTLLAVVLSIAAAPLANRASAEDPALNRGRIELGQVTIEILEPHQGREIRTPEGYLRIEEGPDLDASNDLGSFGTYHAAAFEPAADVPAATAEPDGGAPPVRRDGMVDTAAPVGGSDPCRPQRGRYLRRVLAMSGIYTEHPMELLDGLAGPGHNGGNLLIGGYVIPGFDPVKPLAWDQELRSLARDLASCEGRAVPSAPPPPPR